MVFYLLTSGLFCGTIMDSHAYGESSSCTPCFESMDAKGIFDGRRGHEGHKGHKGKRGEQGKKGKIGKGGSQGPQGPGGSHGQQFSSLSGTLTFNFTSIARPAELGFWRVIIIAPDGTQTLGPLIDITAPSVNFDVTISPTIFVSCYAILIYNVNITTTLSAAPIQGSILVTFNTTTARYTSFVAPVDTGYNQQLYYTPFIPPTLP